MLFACVWMVRRIVTFILLYLPTVGDGSRPAIVGTSLLFSGYVYTLRYELRGLKPRRAVCKRVGTVDNQAGSAEQKR